MINQFLKTFLFILREKIRLQKKRSRDRAKQRKLKDEQLSKKIFKNGGSNGNTSNSDAKPRNDKKKKLEEFAKKL